MDARNRSGVEVTWTGKKCSFCKGTGEHGDGSCIRCGGTGNEYVEHAVHTETADALFRSRMLAIALERLTPDQREEWEERAAIMEYCGGLDRDAAEELALEEFPSAQGDPAQ